MRQGRLGLPISGVTNLDDGVNVVIKESAELPNGCGQYLPSILFWSVLQISNGAYAGELFLV